MSDDEKIFDRTRDGSDDESEEEDSDDDDEAIDAVRVDNELLAFIL